MPTVTQITVTELDMNSARCQALFSPGLRPSDDAPTADMATTVISRAVQQFGVRGCADRMEQEFDGHPDTATMGMCWVRQLIARDACRQAPETGKDHGGVAPGGAGPTEAVLARHEDLTRANNRREA